MKNKQTLIVDFFISNKKNKIIDDNKQETYYCIGCNKDLGYNNPRQYCCKTFCPNEKIDFINN
jgi:hypothetical protein